MSEAVVDDIVAVLPPLFQSLEALGFVARHLNPPDFDRVMESVGQPDEALRAVRPRLEQWPEEFAGIKTRWRRRATRRLPHSKACVSCKTAMASSSAVFRGLRYAAARPGGALSAIGETAAGEPILRRSRAARGRRSRWRGWRSRPTTIPASFMTTTSPAAAAASRSMCRNITRRTARGRW